MRIHKNIFKIIYFSLFNLYTTIQSKLPISVLRKECGVASISHNVTGHKHLQKRLEISEETVEGLEVHVYCTIRLAKTKALVSFKVLRLCFRICKMLFFSRRGLYIYSVKKVMDQRL